jgi:hypothetical protein
MLGRNSHLQGAYANFYLPEDGNYAETCSSKILLNYTEQRLVHWWC